MQLLDRLRALGPWKLKSDGWEKFTQLAPSLSAEQVACFDRDGYLVAKGFFTPDETTAVRDRLFDLIHQRVAVPRGVKFEREVAVASERTDVDSAAYRQVWDLVPADPIVSDNIGLNPRLVAALKSLLGPHIKLYRVTAMLKKSRIGSNLPYHQDSAYWPIEPKSLVSCWVAIDDATKENGCMRVLPGFHKRGLLPFATHSKDGVTYRELALKEEDLAREAHLEMAAGDCLFFHSLLPHATGPNSSTRNRFAIIASYMSAHSVHTEKSKPSYLSVCGDSFSNKV